LTLDVIIEATSREIIIDICAYDNNETESAKVLDITFSLSSENSQISFGGKPTVEIAMIVSELYRTHGYMQCASKIYSSYFTSSSHSVSEEQQTDLLPSASQLKGW